MTECDEYYGESDDMSLNSYVMEYKDSEGGIKNIVSIVYDKLVSRYHNNFYINYIKVMIRLFHDSWTTCI